MKLLSENFDASLSAPARRAAVNWISRAGRKRGRTSTSASTGCRRCRSATPTRSGKRVIVLGGRQHRDGLLPHRPPSRGEDVKVIVRSGFEEMEGVSVGEGDACMRTSRSFNFLLPRRRLHLLEAGAHDHLDVLAAETAGGAAAIHRGVAAAEHDDALADLVGVPNDTDDSQSMPMWMFSPLPSGPGYPIHGRAARRSRHKDRIEVFRQQLLQAVDAPAGFEFDTEVEDVVGLLVDHSIRQTEFRNLRPHHAAGFGVLIETPCKGSPVAPGRGPLASDAGPPPISAMRLPFFGEGFGIRCVTSSL